jgi:S1-C subfamily serine protease
MAKTIPYGQYVKDRVYRVIIKYGNGMEASGSGFFVNKSKFITCFHVVFGGELRNVRNLQEFTSLVGNDERQKLLEFFTNKKPSIFVELDDGSRVKAELKDFSEFYDSAVLKVDTQSKKINVCKLDIESIPTYGESVSFGGFPDQFGYSHDTNPFAYTEGLVSSFPTTIIGGENYEHIKINAINLSGNSGAPLFMKGNKAVIGIINGNMNWGRDDMLASPQIINGQMNFQSISFRVPLSIAYATPLKLIKEKTNLI